MGTVATGTVLTLGTVRTLGTVATGTVAMGTVALGTVALGTDANDVEGPSDPRGVATSTSTTCFRRDMVELNIKIVGTGTRT